MGTDPFNVIFQLTRSNVISHHEFKMWNLDKTYDIRDLIVRDYI